jgi:phage-related protein/predicted XRE-type DNA-binding protein
VWLGSSLDELKEFPEEPRREVGFALWEAQNGGKHPDAKPLKGFHGASVLEIVEDFDTDTYRAVYTVKFGESVYVLHCFQKKSKSGISTPKQDMDLIEKRFKQAEQEHKEMAKTTERRGNYTKPDTVALVQKSTLVDEAERVTRSSGNVFADLGFDKPAEELAKAKLVSALAKVIRGRQLAQTQVADILGVDQPTVSKLLRGRTGGFTIDRLLRLLAQLGQDVEISVRPKRTEEPQVRVSVVAARRDTH